MAIQKCVKCGESYSDSLSTCPHCNYTPTIFVCPECNGIIGVNDTRCQACGFDLNGKGKIPAPMDVIQAALEKVRSDLETAESESKLRRISSCLAVLSTQINVDTESEECERKLADAADHSRKKNIYENASLVLQNRGSLEELKNAASQLETISDFMDSTDLLTKVKRMLSEDLINAAAEKMASASSLRDWITAKEMLSDASKYESTDVEAQIAECDLHIDEITKKQKKTKTIAFSALGVIFGIVAIVLSSVFYFIPNYHYSKGDSLFGSDSYAAAMQEFLLAGDYKDAVDKAALSELAQYYFEGETAFSNSDYAVAIEKFTLAGDYRDALAQKEQSVLAKHYSDGEAAFNGGDYQAAITEFTNAGNYRDAADQIICATYSMADQFYADGRYLEAAQVFSTVSDYEDSADRSFACAKQLLDDKQYTDAAEAFSYTSGNDSIKYQKYAIGMDLFAKKDYVSAMDAFKAASNVENAAEMYTQATYLQGKVLFGKKDYASAKSYFTKVPDYSDAEVMRSACDLYRAEEQYKKGYLNTAQDIYNTLPSDFEYGGISVADRLATLKKYSNFVAMCGKWKATGDCEIESRQTSRSYGSWDAWTQTWTNPSQYLSITCVINGDGTVTVSGSAEFYRFTNYSSLGAYVNASTKTVSFTKTMSSVPNRSEVATNFTLTYSGGSYKAVYKLVDDTESVYFRYTYTSEYTYGSCVQKY